MRIIICIFVARINRNVLGILDKYEIDLKGMRGEVVKYDFLLDDLFFSEMDAADVHKGKLQVSLSVKKVSQAFELNFHTEGTVCVACDRCLDDVELPIVSDDRLCVKFGTEYVDEGDELIVVPEEEGCINVAWFMYEFIVLAIPLRHVHAPGECNKTMDNQLHKYLCVASDDDSKPEDGLVDGGEKAIDPRWNELKKLLDNN